MHGLRVRSEIPICDRVCDEPESVDVTVVMERRSGGGTRPEGDIVAQFAPEGKPLYQLFRSQSGSHLLRVDGVCDFTITAHRDRIGCRLYPGVDAEWLQILLRGTVAALLLDLLGRPTLHASAVEMDGRAVVLAGGSGAGKTTTAAILCAAGARLLSDDVVAVEFDRGLPACRPGSTELRLRRAAAGLAETSSWAVTRRPTIDGRLAVTTEAVPSDAVRLAAVVFPRPQREATRPEVVRLRASDAALWLAAIPRICWSGHPETIQRAFVHASRVASEVPVFAATVPWGPPWPTAGSVALAEMLAETAA